MGEELAALCALAWLATLSGYDIRERRLPNWLTLPGAAAVLALAAVWGRGVPALLGAAALFGAYLAVHLLRPAAMGAGDVKLAIGVGALTGYFGIDVWTLAALMAPILTAGRAVVSIARRSDSTVPHGPSMCAAAALGAFLGLS